jgi:prepilin-type processing-associated H-X9-DG protein
LLVVIAVVGVLVSLLLPVLGKAHLAAKGAKCLANQRSIGQAVVMYGDQNREYYPVSSHSAGSVVSPGAWLQSLEPFGVIAPARICPADPFRASRFTSYATNEHFERLTPGIDYNPITRLPLPGGRPRAYDRAGLVPRPWAVIYAYEPSGEGTIDHLNTHQFQSPAHVAAALDVKRHLGSANFLFADGHAKAWAWSEWGPGFSPQTSPFDPATAR